MFQFLSLATASVVLGVILGTAVIQPDEVVVNVPIEGFKGELGKCVVELVDPANNVVGLATRFVYATSDAYTLPVKVKLTSQVEDQDLLRARITFKGEEHIYSLFQLRDRMIIKVLGQSEFIKGSTINYRVIARNQRMDEPIAGAKVQVFHKVEDNRQPLYQGVTDQSGTCKLEFQLPENVDQADLVFEVVSDYGTEEYQASISFITGNVTYLVTDKPIYQPGQTMHIRSLSLRKPTLNAVSAREITLEVEDSKGNKVFKKTLKTDDFGVAYVPFVIADEVNYGNYTVRAVMDGDKIEKTVKVEKYVLPKFRLALKTDKEYYLPGEKMEGDIDVQYFFGKPVAQGKVKVTVYKFDVGFNEEAVIEGKTDANGMYHLSYTMPSYFVGEPLEKGDAFVRLDIEVIDNANHSEKISLQKKVVQDLITLSVVPEGGALRPKLENRIFVLATYPDGTPCIGSVEFTIDGKVMIGKTDDYGIAEFKHTPDSEETQVMVRIKDDNGETAELSKSFSSALDRDQIILRMARGIYQVGDVVNLEVLTTKKAGRVYLDIIKDNQTALTKSIDIKGGKGALSLKLTPDIAGSIWLHAYIVTPGSDMVRDTRFCFVHGADDLTIKLQPDQDVYLPGDDGSLTFTVTDRNGRPRVAAICLAIVDEAVFAVSELQPGLEKVYFKLEKELMTPRYEIHGFSPIDIVKKPNIDERAENVMFSTLVPKDPFPVNYTTPQDVNTKIKQAFYQPLMDLRNKLYEAINKYYAKHQEYPLTETALAEFVKEGYLKQKDLVDPWGREYRVQCSDTYFTYFNVASAGPDGFFDNEDDVDEWSWGWDAQGEVMMDQAVMAPRAGMARQQKAAAPKVASKTRADGDDRAGPGEEPRVREYFPETFLFEPALITDASGHAQLNVTMPDAITTWRVTAFASSDQGELGSLLDQIKVFQDFFVDIDLPVALTQGDEISIPVAIYNYLPKSQEIRLVLQDEDWFDLVGKSEVTKTLGKDEVSVVYFPIRVKQLGYHSLLVKAYGAVKSDAIKRSISILPDGKRFEDIISDRLDVTVTKQVAFPKNAIAGANMLMLKLYPGIYSQVVEGLDKMLGMPFGCFEQTTSVTYPNVLILDYVRQTEQAKPESEMQAEQYISIGYQRMLSFEVQGGGFSWFGDAPANRCLTAYGLMVFKDMAKVYEIDDRVISRTADWLEDQQNKDGSWSPEKNYYHAETWDRIQHSEMLPTAYIVWGLAEVGRKTGAAARGLEYLEKHIGEAKDPYMLALVANAFVAMDPKSERTIAVLRKLVDKSKEDNGAVYWESSLPSITFSEGKGADIEASGLATYALVRSGKFSDVTTKALTYLIRSKDSYGTWHTTQGTIIALRALVAALGGSSEDVDAVVTVMLNGKKVTDIKVDKNNADVMQQIDLSEGMQEQNTVEIRMKGDGNFLYEITSAYYIPWKDVPRPAMPMFAIAVKYDRTNLVINDLVNVDVQIKLNKPGVAQMVMIDLGIPPGFEVQTPTLDEHVGKEIQKYSLTSRQIIVYLESVSSDKPIRLSYSLKARYPIKAKVRASRVYEYYNLDKEATEEPFEMKVTL